MTVRDAINSALDEELARDSKVYILGEEVWRIRYCVCHDLFVVTSALITLLHDLPVDHGLQVQKGLQLQPGVKSAHTDCFVCTGWGVSRSLQGVESMLRSMLR
jgi:hypothetical protein